MSIRETCKKYREGGLVVMGIQTPEFEFEQNLDSVRREVTAREIDWPVAVGLLDDDRLYQFIRQPGSVQGRTSRSPSRSRASRRTFSPPVREEEMPSSSSPTGG